MKKRIALVVNTLSGGGAERTVSNLSIGLSGKYDVDIVVNDDGRVDYPYEGRLISLNMPRTWERGGAAYQLTALLRRTRVLRRMKNSGRYAAVISFSEMTNFSNVLSGGRHGKTIASIRNSVGKRQRRGLWKRLALSVILPYICRNADLTVSCSKEIADELIRGYGLPAEKSAVIYNGLPLERIRAQAAAPLPEGTDAALENGKLLVSVGRLTPQKGHWHLLPVVKALRDAGLPVRLLILGEGELRPLLEERLARLGLQEHVLLPGFVENPYPYLARADAVVMPSLYEGFSNAIAEAMACGAPLICTDHETGARELLAPDTDYHVKIRDGIEEGACGVLVPVFEDGLRDRGEALSPEEAQMAEAIKRILRDEALAKRYREASLLRAEQLDIAAICGQWIDLIEAE